MSRFKGRQQCTTSRKSSHAAHQELVGDLNPQQAEAVQYRGQALLIGAGAGSGKTRVLTRRIAWILSQFGAWQSQILAITFTNKAAAEMRERLGSLIGPVAQRMWVSTFHSACVRILRRDGQVHRTQVRLLHLRFRRLRATRQNHRHRIQPRHQALHSTLDSRPYLRPQEQSDRLEGKPRRSRARLHARPARLPVRHGGRP